MLGLDILVYDRLVDLWFLGIITLDASFPLAAGQEIPGLGSRR
jgi:hypothetical protein